MDNSTRNIKAILFLLLIPLIGLHSQVLNVTTILDSGIGSLRQAIDMSNEGDTIQFSTLTDGSAILLTSGEIAIDHDLVIIGNDTTNTIISGNGMSRVFAITDADVTIEGVKFTNGTTTTNGGAIQALNSNLEFHSSSVVNSQASEQGGGIYVEGGSLLVQNSSLTENQVVGSAEAHGGAAIAHSAGVLTIESSVLTNNEVTTDGSGGAILIGSDGELTINNSTISGNSAVQAGGAIADNSGSATLTALTNVTFGENVTMGDPGLGGALHVNGDGNVMISGSTFGLNSATAEGGAIWNGSGNMTINGTTIEGNTAGGANAGLGGGVFNNQGSLTIGSSSNIVANTADGENSSGGGIFNNTDATLTIDSSTVSINIAGESGGGISDVSGSASLTTLSNVILQDNGAVDSLSTGGGVFVSGDGEVVINSGTITGNEASVEGGGVWSGSGNVTVNGTTISGNTVGGAAAGLGGGLFNSSGDLTIENGAEISGNAAEGGNSLGGGIYNDAGGALMLNGSTVSGNTSVLAGGGIADNSGSATVTTLVDATIENNTATDALSTGGGVFVSGDGEIMINSGTITGNEASVEGGGVWSGSGNVTVNGTTISGNTVGGAAAGLGGGLFNSSGDLTIENGAEIIGNIAEGENSLGGGIYNDAGGALSINGSTVSGNTSVLAGGGIADNSGSATVTTLVEATIENNTATDSLSTGGGLHVSGDGNIEINSGTIAGNEASVEGGGVWSGSGNVTVNGTTISGNTVGGAAAGLGGGLFNSSGDLTIENGAEIIGNIAEGENSFGGGIYNDAGGALSVNGSTVSGNTSVLAGGGIADNSGSATVTTLVEATIENNTATDELSTGGGVFVSGDGEIMINSGTIAGNEASVEGGGVWSGSGNVTVNGTTISGNTVGGAAAGLGGGLFNSSGDLTIENGAKISGNIAEGENSFGGGIYNDAGGALSVNGSTVSGNTSVLAGGGIADNSGSATVTTLVDAVIESNVTTDSLAGSGAGVYVSGDGNIEINSGTIAGNEASVEGGGIWSGIGNVSINGTTIEGNTAEGIATGLGGGIFNSEGVLSIQSSAEIIGNIAAGENSLGGGIYHDADAMLSIVGSTVSGNTSSQAGAGIADLSGSANMTSIFETDIENNTATDSLSFGGGIYVAGDGDIEISSGTIVGNEASVEGGGIWSGSGNVTVNGTTISGNTVGGAAAGLGGGLFNSSGDLTIENGAEISGNVATGENSLGGGIYNDVDGTLTLDGSTVSGNTAVQAGGGIADNSGSASVTILIDATVENNVTTDSLLGSGAGVYVSGDGNIEINSGTISGNEASVEGGGIWSGSGSVSVNGTTINGNTAGGTEAGLGGGIFNSSGDLTIENGAEISGNVAMGENSLGGGIYNDVDGTLTLDGSTVSGNTAVQAGGGIADNSGSATVTTIVDATIENNTTTDSLSTGGGLYVSGDGNVEITGGAVVSNESAGSGGGLWNDLGVMTLTEVSVEGNTSAAASADSGGGAVYNNNGELLIEASTIAYNSTSASAGNGGGVFNAEGSSATITRSTISSNVSANDGGGIFNAGSAVIVSSTIVQNTSANAGGGLRDGEADELLAGSAPTTVRSSIISENNASSGQDVSSENSSINSMGYNLIGMDDANAFDAQSTDLVGTNDDPMESMVGPLADNGGPTSTHAIDCSSPAVNEGDPDLSTPDQRGENVFGEQRDIGSFEFQDTCAATPTIEAERRVSASYIYPNPVNEGKVVVVMPELKNELMDIHIVEMGTGKVVRNLQSRNPKANLNVSYLPEGNYIIRIQYKGATATHKMVVVE